MSVSVFIPSIVESDEIPRPAQVVHDGPHAAPKAGLAIVTFFALDACSVSELAFHGFTSSFMSTLALEFVNLRFKVNCGNFSGRNQGPTKE
jgi:hypothetical protein